MEVCHCSLVSVFLVTACFNAVLSVTNSVGDSKVGIRGKPLGRAYSLSTCDYRSQVGYSCVTCHRALHCYPGNVAILVDCYGPFRFCRDGRCSRFQGDKCLVDTKLTTPDSFNITEPTEVSLYTDVVDTTKVYMETVSLPINPKDNAINDESLITGSINADNSVV